MERKRFRKEEVLKEDYIQMPKWLFNEEFKSLSNDGKVLYSVLRDRHRLSVANNWVNENGEIYFLFSRENMSEMLNCNIKSAIKYFKELLKFNLVEEKRQGINKPNIIYLLDVSFENQLTGKIYTSRDVKNTTQDLYNLQCNKNDFNNNDFSKNEKSYNTVNELTDVKNNFYINFSSLIKHINEVMEKMELRESFNKNTDKIEKYFRIFYNRLEDETSNKHMQGIKQKILTTKQLEDSINYCLEAIEEYIFTDDDSCLFNNLLDLYFENSEFKTLNGFFSKFIKRMSGLANRNKEEFDEDIA